MALPLPAGAAPTDPSMPMPMTMPMQSPAARRGPHAPHHPAHADTTVGQVPPPPIPTDHYADRSFGAQAMQQARAALTLENGGQHYSTVLVNIGEIRIGDSQTGYRWDGEYRIGGDVDRLVIKSEGVGSAAGGLEDGEAQVLYSHAIFPLFDLQAGLRQDIRPRPELSYGTIGLEGLAPYQFQIAGAAFIATTGAVLGRLEGYRDIVITQRLTLQPRAELNFAAQDVPRDRIGAGLSDAELGLRLRFQIRRELAPYIGVSWDRKTGRTAGLADADASSVNFVVGLHGWY